MRLNRPLAFIASAAIAMTVLAPAQAAPGARGNNPLKGQVVPATLFGMHVMNAEIGSWPTIPIGSLRLWDNQTSWANIEKVQGTFDWTNLDKAVATSQAHGVNDILMVLAGTPSWATNDPSPDALPQPGAAGMPKDFAWWNQWVTAVVTRYKGKITSYQPWNEANLSTFSTGSPAQMADLTKRAYDIIKRIDPAATVVAPSTGTRLGGPFKKFYPAFLEELGSKGWPIDVWAAHTYPASLGTPLDQAALAQQWQDMLVKAHAPTKPMWETEDNYGLKGPGPKNPDVDIDDTRASSWVARTYLDALNMGISRVYWYRWEPFNDLWGIQMFDKSLGAKAYASMEEWIVGATFNGCSTRGRQVACAFSKAGKPFTIHYSTNDKRITVKTKGATEVCTLVGGCSALSKKVISTHVPIKIG